MSNTPLKDYEAGKEDGFLRKKVVKFSNAYMFGYREGEFDKVVFENELEALTSLS